MSADKKYEPSIDYSAKLVAEIDEIQKERDKETPDSFGMTENDYKSRPKEFEPKQTGFLVEQSNNQDRVDELLFVQLMPVAHAQKQLEAEGIHFSIRALSSYKRRREKDAQTMLATHPAYAVYQKTVSDKISEGLMQIRHIDAIEQLTDLIDSSATMLAEADRSGRIQINNIKDYREIQKTMLEAIKTYGELMLMNQRYVLTQQDPTLTCKAPKEVNNTQININVKDALADILKETIKDGDFSVVDAVREVIDITGDNGGDVNGI